MWITIVFARLKPIQDLFKKIRPSFKLLSRKKLTTTLLDCVYENTKKEIEKMINNVEYINLISDGW